METPKKSFHWLKALFWAALWSAVLTTFIVGVIEADNRCFLIVNGATWVWMIATLTWLWLLLFLFFDSNRSRLILMGCSVYPPPHAEGMALHTATGAARMGDAT